MAYSKSSTTSLNSTASLVPNNLAVLTGLEGDSATLMLAVVHKCSVNIVHFASGVYNIQEVFFGDLKDNSDLNYCLTGVRWCRLQSTRVVLILTSFRGFQIFDWLGNKQLYLSRFETPQGTFENRFARGVASVGNHVCIGTSEGGIMMLEIVPQKGNVVYTKQLQGHSASISDLTTNSKGRLASCDENGVIVVWLDPLTCDDTFTVIRDPYGAPCISLCFWNNLLIGGFARGFIRIIDCETRATLAQIAAHARYINALDLAPQAGLLMSVSEDSNLCVWKLPTEDNPRVSRIFSTIIPNLMLCGGRFIDPAGARLGVTAFESKELLTFIKED